MRTNSTLFKNHLKVKPQETDSDKMPIEANGDTKIERSKIIIITLLF